MNRNLKGFSAMNAIAENLRGRTAATREVQFAVNNSKENKTMFGIKRVAIGDGERGLLYKNRRFERVLAPGVYRLWDAFGVLEVRSFDITRPDFIGKDADALIERLGVELELSCALADIGVEEVGLVSKNGKLEDVLAPGTRKLNWKGLVSVTIDKVSLGDSLQVPEAESKRLRQLGVLETTALAVTVPTEAAGLLFIDGKLVRKLEPGAYAFWNFQKNVSAEVIELRVQTVEVSGQELLTKDKVSLRVNLAASIRIIDPVAVRTKVAKYSDYLYRELQYGLRKVVSAKTLDDDIFAYVRGRVGELGIEVLGVGIKDVILPGEMKEILNSVVQAEKAAQANIIRRREETNATRSALNTAKLIEDNPILMRLKELEALEKVTEKIDKLTVFGGLDGVLNQLVKLRF